MQATRKQVARRLAPVSFTEAIDMKTLFALFLVLSCFFGALPRGAAESYTVAVPTGYSLIANHLNRGSNTVADVLPVVPDGVVFTKWNNTTRSYDPSNTFRALMGSWSLPMQTLSPGEGASLQNAGPPFTLTLEGTPHLPVLPVGLTNRDPLLVSRQIAGIGSFEQITGRRPGDGTVVYRYRDGTHWEPYVYWSDSGWTPQPPLIPVGEAVFVLCEVCPSLAPRSVELVSLFPMEGSTNARDASLILRLRDPDAQLVPGSVAAVLDGAGAAPPLFSFPAPGEGTFTWPPAMPMAVGLHTAEFSYQISGFNEYDYNIPAQAVTNSVNFSVQLRPFALLYISPPDGSTNPANEKLTFAFRDPDGQLDMSSIMALLDGSVLTNVFFPLGPGDITGVYRPNPLLTPGAHTFELTYSDESVPPVSYTNRVVFHTLPLPQIQLNWSGGSLTMMWEGGGTLLESDNLLAWTVVPNAVSPHLTTLSGAMRFFRVRQP